MGIGRPRAYKTVEQMQEKIDKYFIDCDANKIPYTVTGLALALDMSRQELIDYTGRVDENGEPFLYTIKKAKNKVENYSEIKLISGNNPTGVIFSLKNNFGWKDKQEIDTNIANKNDKPFRFDNVTTEDLKKLIADERN